MSQTAVFGCEELLVSVTLGYVEQILNNNILHYAILKKTEFSYEVKERRVFVTAVKQHLQLGPIRMQLISMIRVIS